MKRFAKALDDARATRSRIQKEEAIARGLRSIDRDAALVTAARIAVGRTLAVSDGRSLGVGWSLLSEVACEVTGWSQAIVRASSRTTGDFGEAFGLLVKRLDPNGERTGVSLDEVAALWESLASTNDRKNSRLLKHRMLLDLFKRTTALEAKYLAKVLLGELRVGAQSGVVEGAIARAFDLPIDDVRRAAAIVTDAGDLAVLARAHKLNEATLSIGRPVAYMLATPLESIASPLVAADFILEDKIDGVRAQIHKRDDVRIFARGLEDVTRAFPEIVEAFRDVEGHVALDGELVSFATSGRPRPFQALQRRLQRVSPTKEQIAETPVTFVAYDLLADDGGDRLALSWEDRRALLEMFANDRSPKNSFVINPYESAISKNDETLEITVDRAFNCARQRGHEGVVLKRIDAPYEAGRRGQSWIKVKKAFATLDVIVTAVEAGHGKRAGTLSDYTFGVWRGDEIVNVGKAYSGLTDAEIETMSKRFVLSTLERFGGVRLVKPEVVIEVAFDGLQRSTRHKSGFALRFPRIVRIRDDKKPEDADRIEGVEALFRQQVESGHREDPPPEEAKKKIASDPKSQKSTKKASKVAKTRGVQLDLFASIKERG